MTNSIKSRFIGDKKFYKSVSKIALPVLIQSLLTAIAQLVDNVMVSNLGDAPTAAVGTANQVFFVFMITTFGVLSGGQIYIAQYYGAKENEKATTTFNISILFASLFGLIGFLFITYFPNTVLSFFLSENSSTGAIKMANEYLSVVRFTYLIFGISTAFAIGYRAIAKTKVPMYVGFIAVITNTILNFILIYGFDFGFINIQALGIKGAAIATLIARIIELMLFIAVSIKINTPIKINLIKLIKIDKGVLKQMIYKSIPLTINEFFWSFGQSTLVAIYSMKEDSTMAAYAIAYTFANLFFVVLGALGASVSILIGNSLGSDNIEKAKDNSYKLFGFSIIIGFICLILMFGSAFLIPVFFKNISGEITMQSKYILFVLAFCFPIIMGTTSCFFTLRAGGDTRSVLMMDSGFSWLVFIPAAFIARSVLGLPMVVSYGIVQCLELVKLIIAYTLLKKEKWAINLTS